MASSDFLFHLATVGKTGTGKSTLLSTIAATSEAAGWVVIDPHGDHASNLNYTLCNRRHLINFDLGSSNCALRINPFAVAKLTETDTTLSLLEAFKLRWSDTWGVSMEHILRNCILTLLERPDSNLSHINKLLTDDEFRADALTHVTNEQVRDFWLIEYNKKSPQSRATAIAPIQNKLGALLSDPLMYKIFCEPGEQINFREVMDEGKVLIINLSKGTIGSDGAGLLGAMIVSAIGSAAFSRADIPEKDRRPFFVLVDEFQNFTTLAFASMLSELRKYKVGMVLANQYIGQLKPEIREAIFGNVGTLISFRCGPSDAAYLAREFKPTFKERHLLDLPDYHCIIKMMVDGRPSHPFRARTISPWLSERLARNPFIRNDIS